jgi:outer membrane protein
MVTTALAGVLALGPAYGATLTDALITAYQTSPLLESSRASLRSLDENVAQARSQKRPQVDASIGADTRSNVIEALDSTVDSLQAALNASLLLYDNGQTRASLDAARNVVAAARADLTDVEQFVLFSAVEAYLDVRQNEEFVRLARNDVERQLETLRATENRFEVGEVTRTDVSQSESRLANSRSILADSEGALELARQAYLAAVGVLPTNLERVPPLPDVPASLEEATAVALRMNPQIIAAQFSADSAKFNVERAIAAKGPSVRAFGSVGAERGNAFGQTYDGTTFGRAGIEAGMPLYTGGRNDSLVRQAQAVLDQRRYQVQEAGRAVTQQVAAAWIELETARVSIIARREQAEAARIAAEGVAEEARLGARSTIDVLDADQERLQADAEVVRALRDEYVATYGVLRAMGLLTVKHLQLGIETYDPDVYFTKVQSAPVGGYDTSVIDRIRSRWTPR